MGQNSIISPTFCICWTGATLRPLLRRLSTTWFQHFWLQQILSQHYFISTLLYSTPIVFNTTLFQQAPFQHTLLSTHLVLNNFCIQHYLISTIMDSTPLDFNNNGFNNPCFQQTWIQQSLFSTSLVSTILFFNNTSRLSSNNICQTYSGSVWWIIESHHCVNH